MAHHCRSFPWTLESIRLPILLFCTLLMFSGGLGSVARARAQGAIIIVTTTADELNADGDCALREAIQAANNNLTIDACTAGSGDDVIMLVAGTYTVARDGKSEDNNSLGDLDISDNLIINGAGSRRTMIDGGHRDRVVQIHAGANVVLNDLTITNGETASGDPELGGPGDPGGGIYNAGTLVLANSIVSGNSTGDGGISSFGGDIGNGGAGGGIYNTGTLTLESSTVSDNRTGNGGGCITPGPCGSGGFGGGIYNDGTLTLNNSTVTHNITGNGVLNSVGSIGGVGGGIYNIGTLRANWSSITSNSTGLDGPSSGSGGGGIASVNGMLELRSSVISSNTAQGFGAGLCLIRGDVLLVNTVLLNNITQTPGSNISIRGGAARLIHTTVSGDGSGLDVTSDPFSGRMSTVALTNTILVSQTIGITVAYPNTVLLNGVLWFGNIANYGGTGRVAVQNEVVGDPAFKPDGYHLTGGSAALNHGVPAGVFTDIDGELRLGTPDLGADEILTIAIKRAYLPAMRH